MPVVLMVAQRQLMAEQIAYALGKPKIGGNNRYPVYSFQSNFQGKPAMIRYIIP
jgi:hypothetical protein